MAFHSKPRRLNSQKYNFVWYSKTKSQFRFGLNFKLISPQTDLLFVWLVELMEAYWDGWRPKEEGRWKRFQFSIFDAQNSPPTNNKTQSWENVHCHLHCSLVWTIELFETLSLQHGFIPPPPPPSMTGLGSSQNQSTRHHRFSTSHQVFDASHFHPHSVSKIKDSRFYKWNPQVGLQNLLLSFSLGKSNRFHEKSTRHCHSLFGNWTSPRSKSEKMTCMIERK